MGPEDLAQVLRHLPSGSKPKDLLVGMDTLDDAGVYQLTSDIALVQTVDFFTPIVDDPYDFGQVAAANAMSDIYAMGARPITAMNLVAFPVETLGVETLSQVLKGGLDKCQEAGVVLLGGHTIEDAEPKYGLSVTGLAHPGKIVTNAEAKPGDVLVLTKPLGTGILSTAAKAGEISYDELVEAVDLMKTLNRDASRAMVETGVNACTDITGFGLLGHLWEMASASRVSCEISWDSVPLLPRVLDLVDLAPGGASANARYLERFTGYEGGTDAFDMVLCDPQTSGGLLISVPGERLGQLMAALEACGAGFFTVVGRVTGKSEGFIRVTP
ncbi:MAG: selenide, water dikinase SelD [Bacillota bacterium]